MRKYDVMEQKDMESLAKLYRQFLNEGKTERECVKLIAKIAEAHGYRDLETIINNGETLEPGAKIYATHMKKVIMLMEIGEEDLEKGLLFVGSHIDSPRMDLKQNPLYEKSGFAYMDTHYYGGIKKYLWVASPMALHGTVVKKDGTSIELTIGENPEDPVVGVSDLLIHLSRKQMEKPAATVVEGEALDLLVGSRPVEDEDVESPVKAYILNLLKEKYDMEEDDFLSAEIEVVPAGKARDFGLDSSMIMGYGQDDRICAFCSLIGLLHSEKNTKTKVCLMVDKEEIGSVGATGMKSRFMENTVAEVMNLLGQYSELKLRRALQHSSMLSADVNAGYDPMFAEAFDTKNAAFVGKGAVITKFTGSRGKGGSNDANAEFIAQLRRVFDDANIEYQTAEIGKVDFGGGGTIALIPAEYGMNVIDLGTPILNMHAPYELSAKADVYETTKCFKAFYEMK